MLTRSIGRYLSWPIDCLASLLAKTGVPPNVITWSALVVNLWACVFFAAGRFAAAGGLMILAGMCDLLDGPVARKQNRVSKFGGFLESILDRYSDLMLFLGLLVYYVQVNRFPYAILAGTAMAGAVMVSYAQARAESLGPASKVGFWERPERMVLMIVCALANQMELALWILAIGPNITVVHRIIHTWRRAEGKQRSTGIEDKAALNLAARQAKPSQETPATILTRSAGRGS